MWSGDMGCGQVIWGVVSKMRIAVNRNRGVVNRHRILVCRNRAWSVQIGRGQC